MQLNLRDKKLPSAENLRLIANLCISLANKQSALEDKTVAPWESGKTYQKNVSYVSYNGYFYLCSVTNSDIEFNESHWVKLSDTTSELSKADIEALVNLTPEQVTALQSLIDDNSVTTAKTYSSSKIYAAIQDAIAECKDDTLKQIAKKVSGSYKIAATTADVISADYIYLVPNSNTYDLYVLVEGAPTKVGDTSIDLSDYLKSTDAENTYLKQTDAAVKYVTIATVDGHFDDTDIHVTKELKDKLITTDDIATSISSVSTDTQIASAKAVNSELNKKLNVNELVAADKGKWTALQCELADGSKCYRLQIDKDGNANIFTTTDDWITYTFRKVCATSIEDVPTTYITPSFPSSITLGSTQNICYSIKNGWANVSIIMELVASTNLDWFAIASGLPKPDKEVNASSFGEKAINNTSIGFRIKPTGTLELKTSSEITEEDWYNMNFSYPVAES